MKKLTTLALCSAMAVCVSAGTHQPKVDYRTVPLPQSITLSQAQDGFKLSSKTKICYPMGNEAQKKNAEFLASYLYKLTGLKLTATDKQPKSNAIILNNEYQSVNPEAYTIKVSPSHITISGASAAGTFYGIQTLRKSIDPAIDGPIVFPSAEIADQPRFGYRGAHFDTSRHFFGVDDMKTFIDMLALHNINRLHWHISDDQGWRIEIKKFPKLTEIGSWRKGTCKGHDFESSDSIPYGGYYTQQQAREIVDYAADRHITVIPEIDLPGHMLAALTAYPELGCTGGPYEVWQRWGVADDVLCAGNDSTLQFIDDVLTEIVDIFPSEYIHLGGDECPKVRWADCPKCQARIKELGLVKDDHSTAEQKLQSYVMERAAKTLAAHGRKMIGWDEIIEGGLFPGATVMSWRGMEGAQQAAEQGHDAILTPTNFCYFDYSQSQDYDSEPLGIGGYVPVAKVYSLEPTQGLDSVSAKHIIGAQANLWTEYIATMPHVQYMELPRLAALSEVQWMQPEAKDYDDFTARVLPLLHHYDKLGYNYARHIYDIIGDLEADTAAHVIKAQLRTVDNAPIYYTTDGSTPDSTSAQYTEPVVLNKTCRFRAVAIRPQGRSRELDRQVSFNKATSAPIVLTTEPHSRYTSTGAGVLNDGRFGPSAESFNTGEWIGFEGTPLVATIDLGAPQEISSVTLTVLVNTPNWIFDTRGITIETSMDGVEFHKVALEEYPGMDDHKIEIAKHKIAFEPTPARYIKVIALCEESLPAWHGVGEGKPGFLFADEIEVD